MTEASTTRSKCIKVKLSISKSKTELNHSVFRNEEIAFFERIQDSFFDIFEKFVPCFWPCGKNGLHFVHFMSEISFMSSIIFMITP